LECGSAISVEAPCAGPGVGEDAGPDVGEGAGPDAGEDAGIHQKKTAPGGAAS